MLVVKELSGSSVTDSEKIINVAKCCLGDYEKGYDVVVVLSVMGKTTDKPIVQANEINPHPPKREMDMPLVIGEQILVSLMAMAFHAPGVPAVSLNATQLPMVTTSTYGNAKLKRIETERIRHELEARKIVIVTGSQRISKYDDMTTFGRGGSDITAVALAAVPHAEVCEICTDVEGVYMADPRIVPNVRRLREASYDEILEFAFLGAKVLHNRSVEMAKKYGVKMAVRSSVTRAEGTVVKEETKVERMLVSGVAADKNVTCVSVLGVKNVPDIVFKIFNLFVKNNTNVDIIIQSIGRENTKDISFTVAKQDLQDAVELLEKNQEVTTVRDIASEEGVAKLPIIGAGMCSNPGAAAKMLEALYSANVNIKMIVISEIQTTVLVAEENANRTMRTVYDASDSVDQNRDWARIL